MIFIPYSRPNCLKNIPLTAALTYISWGREWRAKKQSLLYIDFLSENPTIPRNHPIRVKQTQNIYLHLNVSLIFFAQVLVQLHLTPALGCMMIRRHRQRCSLSRRFKTSLLFPTSSFSVQ